MDLPAGTRATAVTAAVALTTGLAAILYGVVRNETARALGGVALITIALTLIALVAIRRWVTDTRDEQRQLAQATREAQDERAKYIAAQAALENERQRLMRDAAADRARNTAALRAEREAMRQEFEEERAKLVCETLETAVQLVRGMVDQEPKQQSDVVIQFPTQEPDHSPERERSRGHNVVGP